MALGLKNLDRLCLIVVVAVSLAGGSWVFSRWIQKKKQIRHENELYLKRLNDLNLAETNVAKLRTVLETTRNNLKAVNARVPEGDRMGEFLREVDALMKKRDVALIGIKPLPAVKEKLCTKIPVRLMFEGPFISIYKLLNDLETMNRTLVMEKMVIDKSKVSEGCKADLIANVFTRQGP